MRKQPAGRGRSTGETNTSSRRSAESESADGLERSLTLPWLVFYGVGVTIGAGIFALVGEILATSGSNAPLAFLVAGFVAGVTAVSYMQLVRAFPRAGGEAVFANRGLGPVAGRVAGLGVVVTGTISSAVISIAFAGYVRSIVELPERAVVVFVVLLLALVAMRGAKESVLFAGVLTLVEVGTLLVVIGFGLPLLGDGQAVADTFTPGVHGIGITPIFAGAVVAFFAYVGFEDIANMAEETVDARRTVPRAIAATLVISLTLYVLLAMIAALVPNRVAVTDSAAPLATMFEELSGYDARIVSAMAILAMVNGILVQIVMASRVLYGMAREDLLPSYFAQVDPVRHTPVRATRIVSVAILVLALFFPLVGLAKATSLVTLGVFTLVNLSLFVLGLRSEHPELARWRWHGLMGAGLAFALGAWQIVQGL
jgi:basic amino acid/polyamine antiporter, APA family